jgi:hypothetical protein
LVDSSFDRFFGRSGSWWNYLMKFL